MRSHPVIIYDDTCTLCRMWVEYWKSVADRTILYLPYEVARHEFTVLPKDTSRVSLMYIHQTGKIVRGAEAIYSVYASVPRRRWLLWLYHNSFFFHISSDTLFHWVSKHRDGFYALAKWIWGEKVTPATYGIARWMFTRALGFVYFFAFGSLFFQILGLIGSRGILGADAYLRFLKTQLGTAAYWVAPTLGWISSSDTALLLYCVAGLVLSVFLIVGFFPKFASLGLWALYLSLVVLGQEFLRFQWDNLLLEAGFLAIFVMPWDIVYTLRTPQTQSPLGGFFFKWLLFRLMFMSGAVKLLSGDPTWQNLTALTFHFETQPLPTWISWYAHQLPLWLKQISLITVYFVELVVPFFIFSPRRLRHVAGFFIVGFQVLIILTGNYTFFNFLTIALCLFLFDDNALKKFFSKTIRAHYSCDLFTRSKKRLFVLAAVVIFAFSGMQLGQMLAQQALFPGFMLRAQEALEPFRIVNRYGLFSVMTTKRPEIILEGTLDGSEWKEYTFIFKPQELERRPQIIAPYHPRLDWQMWFAALYGNCLRSDWFLRFEKQLLDGSPDVISLLQENPFSDAVPKRLRAKLYEYHFTDIPTKRKSGEWWYRVPLGEYCPELSLESFRQEP